MSRRRQDPTGAELLALLDAEPVFVAWLEGQDRAVLADPPTVHFAEGTSPQERADAIEWTNAEHLAYRRRFAIRTTRGYETLGFIDDMRESLRVADKPRPRCNERLMVEIEMAFDDEVPLAELVARLHRRAPHVVRGPADIPALLEDYARYHRALAARMRKTSLLYQFEEWWHAKNGTTPPPWVPPHERPAIDSAVSAFRAWQRQREG